MSNPGFNWLHLTDLHFGLSGQKELWPTVKAAFFDDLAKLSEKCGPWDAVLFTGDFVQKGSRDEYQRLDDEVLGPLWEKLAELGSGDAVLQAVPGNHDLVRPAIGRTPSAAEKFLLKPELFANVADEFWSEPNGEYRAVVNNAFENFLRWREDNEFARRVFPAEGLLPGDFALSLELAEERRVGVLGLNTTFLQLAGGDYTGKLAWDLRQATTACGGDLPAWIAEHDVCLLLTHQGPEWLDDRGRDEVYPEINPAGRFAVHLFGHMHENVVRSTSTGGGKPLRQWQGNSLFSMEPIETPSGGKQIERRDGSNSRRHRPSCGTGRDHPSNARAAVGNSSRIIRAAG